MSNADAISKVLGSFGGQLGLLNTAAGYKNADGSVNLSSTLQGVAATTESQLALVGKSWGGFQFGIGVWGIYNVGDQVYANYQKTGTLTITGSQLASLAGNTLNVVMGLSKSTPLGFAAGTVGTTVLEYGFGLYEKNQALKASSGNYSNEGHNYPTYNSSNPQDVFTPPMAIINGTAVNLETATIVMDVATGHLSWTDINVLASEYRSSGLTDPLAYATELAEHAPPELDALDVFFSAYEAATSSTPSTPDSKSSSSSSSDSSDNYSGTTSESLSYAYGGGGWYPIVIDLDGDGVEIKPLTTSTTFFDADNDGYAERTAWAGADDGILMIDLGGDGKVTDAKEVAFANWTTQDDTDLQALATVFDSNADGVFDARDARFREFRLWKDANGNGEVDSGELQTLEQAGVRSMDLKVKDGTALDLGEGSKVHGLFKVELTNGKTVDGADVTFGYSATGVRKGVDAINDVFYWKWA